MVVVKWNLSDEIMQKIEQIFKSGGFAGEKDVVIRAIVNLYEDTIGLPSYIPQRSFETPMDKPKPLTDASNETDLYDPWIFRTEKIFTKLVKGKIYSQKSNREWIDNCRVPKTRELYGKNDDGLIWKFHNRFFVIKWIVQILGSVMLEKETAIINMQEFRDILDITTKEFIDTYAEIENLQLLLVGFPSNKAKFFESPRLRKMKRRKMREEKAKHLEITSMERYLSQNFGRVLQKKENEKTKLAGACFEFGLLEASNINSEIFIKFSKQGLDFALMDNPTLSKFAEYEGRDSLPNFTLEDFELIFSKTEQKFILETIIPNFELENKIVKRYLKKNRIYVKEMVEIFLKEQREYMNLDKDVIDVDAVNEYGKGKATTIMRRLVEIGQFVRRKEDGFDKSGKKMQVIFYERL